MLTVNPAKRVAAAEALRHPWICVSLYLLIVQRFSTFSALTLLFGRQEQHPACKS